jgi:DNA-binding IclR family transcriptional regulator
MRAANELAVPAGDRGVEQTFGRAAALLEALAAAQEGGLRFTDLVQRTSFSKATVHRLLAGLSLYGFVEVDAAKGRYFLGFRLAAWAAAARNRFGISERADPIMRELAEHTEDTAYLSLRVAEMSICLTRHEGRFPIRALPLQPGDQSALGVGSGSLALLAFLSDLAEVDRILASPVHAAARDRRGVSEEVIRHHVAAARRRGFSLVDDLTPGMTGMAVPVRNQAGQPVAAISVATISARLRPPRRQMVLGHLQDAAQQLEHVFRWAISSPK